MAFSNQKKESLKRHLLTVVDQYRSMIIDPIEQELGTSTSWKFLRGRLLKALGDRGLAGRICEVVDSEFSETKEE